MKELKHFTQAEIDGMVTQDEIDGMVKNISELKDVKQLNFLRYLKNSVNLDEVFELLILYYKESETEDRIKMREKIDNLSEKLLLMEFVISHNIVYGDKDENAEEAGG